MGRANGRVFGVWGEEEYVKKVIGSRPVPCDFHGIPAGARDEIRRRNGNNPKPGKYLKNAARTHLPVPDAFSGVGCIIPVHFRDALLGGFT